MEINQDHKQYPLDNRNNNKVKKEVVADKIIFIKLYN